MSFIDGTGVRQGPAPVVTISPEHEQDAPAKLARAREAGAKRKAEQAAGITETTTSAPESSDAPELSEAVDQSSSPNCFSIGVGDHDSPARSPGAKRHETPPGLFNERESQRDLVAMSSRALAWNPR
jgi:hypothetical protein